MSLLDGLVLTADDRTAHAAAAERWGGHWLGALAHGFAACSSPEGDMIGLRSKRGSQLVKIAIGAEDLEDVICELILAAAVAQERRKASLLSDRRDSDPTLNTGQRKIKPA